MPAWLDGPGHDGPVALGIDTRNRDFATDAVLDVLGHLTGRADTTAELLYLDCATDVLLRRYSETRRRHPMAPEDRPADGVAREQDLLRPLRARADVLIDTSNLNVHQLRAEVERWFAPGGQHHLSVSVQSFSYKRGLPQSVDMVFDCRFLRNPYWEADLRALNGQDKRVSDYVQADPNYPAFAEKIYELCHLILPAARDEGKSHVSIAFGCTGGQHRSVTLAQAHALRLAQAGWQVAIRHRELDGQQKTEAPT